MQLEKQKKQLLFSYGTLQLDNVQIETYGRKLYGKKDILMGYRLDNMQIKDESILKKSNQEFHPIAIKSDISEEKIEGKIFEINTEELLNTDLYEVDDYKRVLETFKSGLKAWVYIKK
nr:gamma-glutamylcyclotransferase family protein [uncultured Lacinutrix sp.]